MQKYKKSSLMGKNIKRKKNINFLSSDEDDYFIIHSLSEKEGSLVNSEINPTLKPEKEVVGFF